MEEVSLRGFLRFTCEHLRVSYEAITDTARKQPVISKDTLANAIVGATALGARSVREADFLGRSPVMKAYVGRAASDTTLTRVAGGFDGTGGLLRRLWRRMRSQGHLGIDGEHVSVIDGTSWGKQLTSVVAEIGKAPAIVATRPIPGTGNELSASLKLIHQLAAEEGHFTDYLLGDGLYPCERFWKACDAATCWGLAKTSDYKPYAILQQARLLFDHPIRGSQVGYQYLEAFDAQRACHYRLWQTTGLWANTRRRLTVARVEETFVKGKRQTEIFWVLCQDLAIAPKKLLDLMHARWFIENNVFKAFNDQAHSKHQFSRTAHTAEVFSHLQAIAFMALGAYRNFLERHHDRLSTLWDHGRIPLRLLQSVFRLVLSPADTS